MKMANFEFKQYLNENFQLRQYTNGKVGWVEDNGFGDKTRLIVHIKNSDNPFANLVITDEKQAMQLRNLLGDFLLYKAREKS